MVIDEYQRLARIYVRANLVYISIFKIPKASGRWKRGTAPLMVGLQHKYAHVAGVPDQSDFEWDFSEIIL